MNAYQTQITIKAKSPDEANKKMQAIYILLDKLNEKELTKLSLVVKDDPIKTRMAKMALGL